MDAGSWLFVVIVTLIECAVIITVPLVIQRVRYRARIRRIKRAALAEADRIMRRKR